MVVLGFRPKGSAPPQKENQVPVVKTEVKKIEAEVKMEKKPIKPTDKPAKKQVPHKAKIMKRPVNVSSNWQKLKSLNTLKVAPGTTHLAEMKSDSSQATSTTKTYISDAQWFGITAESLQNFNAARVAGLLKTNATAMSLFPPAPSREKAQEICKYIAIDCEMVGVGLGGTGNALARVSVVNFHGHVLLDVYVKVPEKIVDFRTQVSGITPSSLTSSSTDPGINVNGQPLVTLKEAQERVCALMEGRIVVGHSLANDFSALMLSLPRSQRRDTSTYPPFRQLADGKAPSLKLLAAHVLSVQIQEYQHDSVEDARYAMLLYRAVKKEWESQQKTFHKSPEK